MTANPDITDLIITYIRELWPHCNVERFAIEEYGPEVFYIKVNNYVIGITSGLTFASWNPIKNKAELLEPTDKNFFEEIKYWAKLKAGLNEPKRTVP